MAVGLLFLPFVVHAQLLKGKVKGQVDELQVMMAQDGDVLTAEYLSVPVAEDGTFSFDAVLRRPFCDVTLLVGEKGLGGAHLVKGKILEVEIEKKAGGEVAFAFRGEYAGISEFYTSFVQRLDLMRYCPMDESQRMPYETARKTLEKDMKAIRKMLAKLENGEMRAYYGKLADMQEKSLIVNLIQDEAQRRECDEKEFPEYREIMASVDLNDEMYLMCGLSYRCVSSKLDIPMAFRADMEPYCAAYMDVVEREVTNPLVKKALVNYTAHQYFSFGRDGNDGKFWERFQSFAADYPEVVAHYRALMEAKCNTEKGTAAPDVVMTAPDGREVRLSELFGKFLYIDVWATWCGPCCAEIPHLEKLVERFAGNDKVRFVSISIDAKEKPWRAKLEKDRPTWEQFILIPERAAAFQQAWNISGIPRFIMIDREGKIFSADAPRPSEEKAAEIIKEQTEQ